jgi:hypothetical protein
MHLSDNELNIIAMPFQALDKALEDVPENQQVRGQVNLVLKILSSKKTPSMMGGSSVASKTKEVFEMFHLA